MLKGVVSGGAVPGFPVAPAGTRGLLERENERQAIVAALKGAILGRGSLLFFVGGPGLGKSRLLQLTEELAGEHPVVVRAGGHEIEREYPFALVQQVLEGILRGYGQDLEEFAVVPDSLRRLLHRSLPVDLSPAEGLSTRVELTYAFSWLVGSVAERRPLLLCLDDLHWVDPDSLVLLHSLARRIRSLPVTLVGAFRPWPTAASQWAEDLVLHAGAAEWGLKPLGREASAGLLDDRLGGPVEAKLGLKAFEFTGGNPFLLEEFAKFVKWQLGGGAGDETSEPSESWLLARLGGLPPDSWRYLRAGSIIGSSFPAGLVAELAELGPAEAELALEPLRRLGLLLPDPSGRFRFHHPLLRHVVYDALTVEARRFWHRRTAEILKARGEGPVTLAPHLAQGAGPGDLEAIGFLRAAATESAAAGAYEVAADFLEKALGLEPPRPARGELLYALGTARLAAGLVPMAVEVLAQAIALPGLEPGLRWRIRRSWAGALLLVGDSNGARRQLELAIAEAREADPVQAVDIAMEKIKLELTCGNVEEIRSAIAEALEFAAESGDAQAQASATVVATLFDARLGEPQSLARTREHVLSLPPSDAADIESIFGLPPRTMLALIFGRMGRVDEAIELLKAVRERGRSRRALFLTIWSNAYLAEMEYRRGRLRDAYLSISESTAQSEHVPYIDAWASHLRGRILGEIGEFAAAAEALRRARTAAQRGRVVLGVDLVRWAEATLLSRQGRDEASFRLFSAEEEGNREPMLLDFNWRLEAAEVAVRLGRLAEAERYVQTVVSSTFYESHAGIQAAAWRAIALYREASGDRSGAAAAFDFSLARHSQGEETLELGRTLLAYGSFLRRSGRAKEARVVLHQAHRLFADCGTALWLGRVEAELRLAGGRRRAGERLGLLTAQEHRIGQLVAEGRSNREISCTLFISLKTLETHLRHIYQKLSLSSREELRGYFSASRIDTEKA